MHFTKRVCTREYILLTKTSLHNLQYNYALKNRLRTRSFFIILIIVENILILKIMSRSLFGPIIFHLFKVKKSNYETKFRLFRLKKFQIS